jgi:hypothetical protein
MKLAFKILGNVNSVNSFRELTEVKLQSGNPDTLYFRIVDQDQPSFSPDDGSSYLRFVPPTGATATAKFDNIDTNKQISRVASQPYDTDDRSVWSVPILVTDHILFNGMTVELTFGGNTYVLRSLTDIASDPAGFNRFFC